MRTYIEIDPDTNERTLVDYCKCGAVATVGVHYPPDFVDDEDLCNECHNKTKTKFNRSN